jgi:hypothetical protein
VAKIPFFSFEIPLGKKRETTFLGCFSLLSFGEPQETLSLQVRKDADISYGETFLAQAPSPPLKVSS